MVIKTLDPLDLPDPVLNIEGYDDDDVGCTIGEEVVCEKPDKNTSKLPLVNLI